ncbi:MAG TPA: hypothetical protein VEK15_23425, partial [Vicinamibacteria bacterium]|nr:hypothetical protein [Vicinamibacteria bacterium]
QAENDWLSLRHDVDELARAYHVAWNWSDPQYTPGAVGTGPYHRLTGTYQLESNQGDSPRQAAEKAARTVPADRRQRTYQSLMSRLEAPDVIAIDRIENRVTMASSLAPRVAFEADGQARTERWSGRCGRNSRTWGIEISNVQPPMSKNVKPKATDVQGGLTDFSKRRRKRAEAARRSSSEP